MREDQKNNFGQIEQTEENQIDIRRYVYLFLSKWYWFVFSVIFFIGFAFLYLKWTRPVYQAKMSVLIKQEQNSQDELFLLKDLGYGSGKNNIDDEIGVFKSPDLMTKVITSLDLYTSYRQISKFRFYSGEMYNSTPLFIRWEDIEPEKIPSSVTFIITKNGNGIKVNADYFYKGIESSESVKIENLPAFIDLKIGKFSITKNADRPMTSSPLKVVVSNPINVAKGILSGLNIVPVSKMSSLLDITLKIENPQKGIDILNKLLQDYNIDANTDKNMIASNTSIFIGERLKEIAGDLEKVETDVEDFLKRNKVVNLETQAGSYIQRNDTYETQRRDLETKLKLIGYIETFVGNNANRDKVIPNLGTTDPNLTAMISKYNQVLIDKERVQSGTSAENPAYIQYRQQAETMRESIKVSLQNEYRATQIAMQDLDKDNVVTNMRANTLPTVQRQYNEILREQSVKANLFTYLLQKREETNLTQAGVAPKGKQIARAYFAGQVSPKKPLVYMAFFLLAIFIPGLIIYLLDYFKTKIEGAKDLDKLRGTSVIGDITEVTQNQFEFGSVVVRRDDVSEVTEMFRTFRNNLLFMIGEREQKVILVTSTVPKEGKTFVAINLARSLAFMDKRVLIVGGDLRNPKLHTALGVQKPVKGFSTLLAGLEDHIREVILEIEPNLSFLPTGNIPPNPNELLSKPRTAQLMEILRRDYDYIVIDSAPMGLVTDSMLLSRFADATVYVMRDNYTEKESITFLNNIISDNKIHNVGVVLNYAGAGMSKSKYNYAYRYGYRYNYAYRYKYGYGYKYGND